MTVEVDFTEAGDVDFEPLPQGWYEVSVYEAKFEESQNGKRMVAFEFKVQSPIEFDGRRLWMRNMIGAKDKNFYLKKTLNALGIEVDGIVQLNLNEILGLSTSVRVGWREWEGKTKEEVVDIRPTGTTETVSVPYDEDLGEDMPPHGDDDAVNF